MATLPKSDRITIVTLASAIAGPFDLTFRLFDDDGLEVYVNDLPRTDFTISSNYVDGYDDNATITFDAPLEIADVIRIHGDLTPDREVDYVNGPGLTDKLNIELARIWSALSEEKRDSNRSLKFFQSVSPIAIVAARVIIANAAGDGFEFGPTADEIANAQSYAIRAETAAESINGITPEGYGYGDGVTGDTAAMVAFFAALPGNVGVLAPGATYVLPQKISITDGDWTLHANGATLDYSGIANDDGDATGSLLGIAGTPDTEVAISSIATVVDAFSLSVTTVTTSTNHGLSVGDEVYLSSDDLVDLGHHDTETRGQRVRVKTVPSSTTFTIFGVLNQTLPTNPVMTPVYWCENVHIKGRLRMVGPGRRPTEAGYAGLTFTYCRDSTVENYSSLDVDYNAISRDNCARVNFGFLWTVFGEPGSNTNVQYGDTMKNGCVDCFTETLLCYGGKHAFDWSRNDNPGVGSNCRFENIFAYNTWDAAVAMHGNARNCSIGYIETTECRYGLNIRSVGWRIGHVHTVRAYGIVTLTQNPYDVTIEKITGDRVGYGLRAYDLNYIGAIEAGLFDIGDVSVSNIEQNTVNLNFSTIPGYTQTDAACTGGTTVTMTTGDFPNDQYNNSGALGGAILTIKPAGTGAEYSRTVNHTYSGGVNTFTWTGAIGTAPQAGVATYSFRTMIDDVNLGKINSTNCDGADVVIYGNLRRFSLDVLDVSHVTVTAEPCLLIQGDLTSHMTSGSIGRWRASGKDAPNISSFTEGLKFDDDITPECMAAIGDGVKDDTNALTKIAAFCNSYGYPLEGHGTYLTTASIPYLHDISVSGAGSIKRGSDQWYFEPGPTQANTIYLDAAGDDGNDGLSASQPIATTQRWADIARARSPMTGQYYGVMAAGTYAPFELSTMLNTEAPLRLSGPDKPYITGTATAGSSNTITITNPHSPYDADDALNGATVEIFAGTGEGQTKTITDQVASTNVLTVDTSWSVNPDATSEYVIYDPPTAIIDGTASPSATALFAGVECYLIASDILVQNFTSGQAANCISGTITLNNFHTRNTKFSTLNQHGGLVNVNGGLWDGNNISSGEGYRALYNAKHALDQTTGQQLLIRNFAGDGVQISEGGNGHADRVIVTDCGVGLRTHRGSGAINPKNMKLYRNGIGHWTSDLRFNNGIINGTGADANTVNVRLSGNGGDIDYLGLDYQFLVKRAWNTGKIAQLTLTGSEDDWFEPPEIRNHMISDDAHKAQFRIHASCSLTGTCTIAVRIDEDAGASSAVLATIDIPNTVTSFTLDADVIFTGASEQICDMKIIDQAGNFLTSRGTATKAFKNVSGALRITCDGTVSDTVTGDGVIYETTLG